MEFSSCVKIVFLQTTRQSGHALRVKMSFDILSIYMDVKQKNTICGICVNSIVYISIIFIIIIVIVIVLLLLLLLISMYYCSKYSFS